MISYRDALRSDLSASVVVFLVALPLCLGIALASGAPFFSGIISGIVGGIIIGFLSNSHVSVSGPAAGLATIVFAAIASLDTFEMFLTAVVLAGVLQLVMGYLKIGSIAEYFPSGVIRGMLTGIGLIIILKQIPHGLGYDKDQAFLNEDGMEGLDETLVALADVHPGAVTITLLSLAIMILWNRPLIKKYVGVVPAALMVVLMGIGLNAVFSLYLPSFQIQPEHLVLVPEAKTASEFLDFFAFPDFNALYNTDIYVIAFTLAIVASIETLLCIEAGDRLDKQRRVTSTDRELKAQGVGNIVSGMIGGLPITSVIVRTSTNVHANAKTKMSTIFHGLQLLLTVMLIPHLLNLIPLASLAAILLVVGYKLAEPAIFKRMYDRGYSQFIPFIVTVILVVTTDLLTGVAVGMAVALFMVLRQNLNNSIYFHDFENHSELPITFELAQEVSFLNKAAIRRELDRVPENSTVIFDAENSVYIDSDILELLKEFKDIKAPLRNIECNFLGEQLVGRI